MALPRTLDGRDGGGYSGFAARQSISARAPREMHDLPPLVRWFTAPARPWSSWAVDGAIVGYALWTAVCHAVMLLGGSTHSLVWAMTGLYVALGVAAALGGYARYRSRGQPRPAPSPAVEPVASREPPPSARSLLRAHGPLAAAALLVLGLWLTELDFLYKWAALCAYLLLAFALDLRSKVPAGPPPPHSRFQEAALWTLALASAWLSLYVHRWRNDDCFYINLAVTIADLPHQALLSVNTIHAPDASGLQPVFTPYRVHSFEALGGYLSFLSGVPAINVIHVGMGAVASLLIPLALARLFRLLDPQRWLPMVLAAMCIYLFEGSSGLGYGNHGIVRSFTGKSVLLSMAIPVLVHHGIAFARAPSARRWLMLLAAQITAVGLSSTALWLAPVAAMLAVIVPLQPNMRALRVLGAGLLSCAYVLALAFWVRAQLLSSAVATVDADDAGSNVAAAAAWAPNFGLLYWWLKKMFAEIPVADHYLSLMVIAIAAARTGLLRRYLVIFCAALALGLMNPYLGDFVRFNITGKWTGERVLFLLPVPALVAAAFCAVLPARRFGLRRALGLAVAAIALAWFFRTVPLRPVLAASRDTSYHWPPGPKVPGAAYQLDQRITALQLGERQVLAPEVVSWFLPTIHHHPYPVLANAKYLAASNSEKKRRKRLVELVSAPQYGGLGSKDRSALQKGIARYDIGAIVLTKPAKHTPGMIELLTAAGFERGKGNASYDLWLRKGP